MKINDQGDEDVYWGNMWGWKISYLGLALIVILLALMGWRKCEVDAQEKTNVKIERSEDVK